MSPCSWAGGIVQTGGSLQTGSAVQTNSTSQPCRSPEKKRRINIPLFIPHEGCPHACIFCDQKTITGTGGGADRDIVPELERAFSTIDPHADSVCEIAFFGGSFTGIDRQNMIRLLESAYPYIENRRAESIRISTRPDYIDDEILSILAHYGVRHIELGIQSTDERVLLSSGRGHTVSETEAACEKIVSRGFILGGQMMLGLPDSTAESERKTAGDIVRYGAKEARIYPTAVFPETPLYALAESGKYTPLALHDAVCRAADCYEIVLRNGVTVLRVGLYSGSTNRAPLPGEKPILGVTHPAFGELCIGAVYGKRVTEALSALSFPREPFDLKITCRRGEISKISGQKGVGKKEIFAFCAARGAKPHRILWEETDSLSPFEIKISAEKK